ncbi:MAG: hypothetical protein OEZ00_00805 [Dehalococcoidia bacterium]|nr:hypothetical protein [Dehalococcoidia bacterium]
MYIRSTGLGKTLLQCKVASVECSAVVPATLEPPEKDKNETTRILMTLSVIAPVTWTVRAFLEPADVRQLIGCVIKNPKTLLKAIRLLIFGGGYSSLVVASGGGEKKS